MKRSALAGSLLAAMALLATACGGGGSSASGGDSADSPADPGKVTGDIKVLTQRTDLVQDGTMKKYAAEFTKLYPKVHVTFEGITDYEGEVKIRMNTSNYGDVLMIPAAIKTLDYPKFFASLGTADALAEQYTFTDKATVGGKVYGIANFANVQGFVYNKTVWQQAGITDWPTTPDEFLADLAAVKAKTSATPYYTNYKDGWPLTAWTQVQGAATCDPKAGDEPATQSDPWQAGTDLNIGDTLLYDIVHDKLSEQDPTTTNWENSKNLLATGKIGTMWLGSWAIVQMQDAAKKAGKDPGEIGYMPFPAQKDGKFCTPVAPDYQEAVNIHSGHKAAARAWIDWFTDKSGYVQTNQAVPTLKGGAMPSALKPFQDAGVRFVEMSQAQSAKVTSIDNQSEIGMTNKPDYRRHLIDVARGAAGGDLHGIFADLAKKWASAQKTASL
ncbi:ABC transporter substrate-binding protein [Actinacidiphila bryophytorum]|nr:extracellular solute-binding protein [Actinacidiphila bryophytorum]MBM9440238.1 extracellular solute-binding protein [Actinacidiphila bryophytorum]MBN6545585.1 extracellular solute-binding protein [Actinacidiphila bryophytorum]